MEKWINKNTDDGFNNDISSLSLSKIKTKYHC